MSGATVSVVIAAYHAMPYVTRCVTSVAEQSTGRDRLEIIVVDDGSTDGTSVELDRLQGVHPDLLRVLRRPAACRCSGGPATEPAIPGADRAGGRGSAGHGRRRPGPRRAGSPGSGP
nr:glycosyltransferase [Streptomyces sp. Caat 7-52]